MKKSFILTIFVATTILSFQANTAPPTEAEIAEYLTENPNDLSGLQKTHSYKGYQQFDFNTVVDMDKLKKTKGKLYSTKEDVMKVLMGG